MIVNSWHCWLEDGSVIVNDPLQLPDEGCLGFIIFYEDLATPNGPHYRDIVVGADWYVLKPDGTVEKYGGLTDGSWSVMPVVEEDEILIKSAAALPDEEWDIVRAEMMLEAFG